MLFIFMGFFCLFVLIVLHTPITALNQARLNIFFTIPFLHGCCSPSLLFLTSVQLLRTISHPWYLEVQTIPTAEEHTLLTYMLLV